MVDLQDSVRAKNIRPPAGIAASSNTRAVCSLAAGVGFAASLCPANRFLNNQSEPLLFESAALQCSRDPRHRERQVSRSSRRSGSDGGLDPLMMMMMMSNQGKDDSMQMLLPLLLCQDKKGGGMNPMMMMMMSQNKATGANDDPMQMLLPLLLSQGGKGKKDGGIDPMMIMLMKRLGAQAPAKTPGTPAAA